MLDDKAKRATRNEMLMNLALAGRGESQVARELGLPRNEVRSALRLEADADPAQVWRLRDHLVQAVRAAGREPVPFTVLTEEARDRLQPGG